MRDLFLKLSVNKKGRFKVRLSTWKTSNQLRLGRNDGTPVVADKAAPQPLRPVALAPRSPQRCSWPPRTGYLSRRRRIPVPR
jgi:hypothetical protein